MSSDDEGGDQETFEAVGADAEKTYPIRAGEVKKGSFVVIKDHPCKVIDYSTSKTGKHGHAKAKIVATDIFTGRNYQDVQPTSHNMLAPIVNRREYQLVDVSADGFASLLDATTGETLETLKIPPAECDPEEMPKYQIILDQFAAGDKEVNVIVISAMGIDMIQPNLAAGSG